MVCFIGGIDTCDSQKEVGGLLAPPTGKEKASSWMGLEAKHDLQLKYDDVGR